MLKKVMQSLAITGAITIAIPTIAAAADNDVKRVEVHYADLRLDRDADVATLYSRLKRAADAVCGEPDVLSLAKIRNSQACIEQALDRAVADVNAMALTELHARPSRLSAAR
jgi:UrcA family protein